MSTRILAAAMLIGMGPVLARAAGIDVQLSSAQDVYLIGEPIEISVAGTTDELLVGFGFDLDLDDADPIAYDGFSVGSAFTASATPDGDGLAGLSFSGGVTGTSVLGTALFTANEAGTVNVSLSVTPGDLTEGFAQFGSGFFDITANTLTLTVGAPVAPGPIGGGGGGGGPDVLVPEPATAMFLMTGAIAVIRTRGRRSRI